MSKNRRDSAGTVRKQSRPSHNHIARGLNDLSAAVVATVLAGSVHDLRVAAVIALHELGGLQLVVVCGAALPGAGLRVSSFRYGHVSISGAVKTERDAACAEIS